MMKATIIISTLVLAVLLAGNAWADTTWTNDGGDGDWNNSGNWSDGLPDSADDANVENTTTMVWPTLDGDTGFCDQLRIAHTPDTVGELTVAGGAILNVDSGLRIGRRKPGGQVGALYISGETTTIDITGEIECGRYGDATIEMTGGTVTANGVLVIAYRSESTGHVQLDGGTLRAGGLNMRHEGAPGTIDIAGGALVLAGQWYQDSDYFKEDGWIVAHGGDEGWFLYFDYNGLETTITALAPGSNIPPVVDASEDKVFTLPDDTVKLDGSVSDDGIGDPNGFLEIWWSLDPDSDPNAPNGVTFGDLIFEPNEFVAEPNVTFPEDGEYVLRLYAGDGEKSSSDTTTVTVHPEGYVPPPSKTYFVTRLNNSQPIITEQMFIDLGATHENSAGMTEGENINGASAIRIPDWIAPENRTDPSAIYYLYFAHHRGDYIRLAWAEDIEGPWQLYNVGTGVPLDSRGVLSLNSNDEIDIGNDITVRNHIASPDVFADDDNERIIMYFHSPTRLDGTNVGQNSFVATSDYGLDFNGNIEPVILGGSYFRVFDYNDNLYALDNGADLYKAPDANEPWTPPPGFDFGDDLWTKSSNDPFADDLEEAGFSGRVRHTAVRVIGDTLEVFYSRRGDTPERIQMSTIDLVVGDYDLWDSTFPPEEILEAEPGWEGGQFPPDPSEGGDAPENVNQLRDPYVFEDIDGVLYLFYSGCGEDAIGIAQLDPVVPGDFEPDGDVDYYDLAVLAAQWLQNCGVLAADLDGDGTVNFFDFALLAEHWSK